MYDVDFILTYICFFILTENKMIAVSPQMRINATGIVFIPKIFT
jgi:hypothetical protein